MNIGHQRNSDALANLTKSLCGFHGGHRHADNIGTGQLNSLDLLNGGGDIGGLGVGHALHRDRRLATYRNITHHDTTRFTTLNGRFTMHTFSRLLVKYCSYSPIFTVNTLFPAGGAISTAAPFNTIFAAAALPSFTWKGAWPCSEMRLPARCKSVARTSPWASLTSNQHSAENSSCKTSCGICSLVTLAGMGCCSAAV